MRIFRGFLCVLCVCLILFPGNAVLAAPSVSKTADTVGAEVKPLELCVVGDIMALGGQLRGAHTKNGYDFSFVFKYVAPILQSADIAIGNLETPIAGSKYPYTNGSYRNGYPYLNAPEAFLDAVKNAGFDVLTTANNHCLDCGEQGLYNTLDAIAKRDIKSTGTFKTKEERDKPLIVEAKGIKVAVLDYTQYTNSRERTLSRDKRTYVFNKLNVSTIKKDIKSAKKAGADVVMVFAHWGTENVTRSNSFQRQTARQIAAAGADIIIGSHPHVLQETTSITSDTPYGKKTCFVAYSLGNFVSSMGRTTNKDAAVLKFTIKKSKSGKVSFTANGIATCTFSRFNNHSYIVLPYYNTKDFTKSESVVRTLKSSFARSSKILSSTKLKMIQ